jgi:hypothetical protein
MIDGKLGLRRRFTCAARRSRHYPRPVCALQKETAKYSNCSPPAKIFDRGSEILHLVVVLLPTHPLDRLEPSLEKRCNDVPSVLPTPRTFARRADSEKVRFSDFEISDFEFASDFEFQISDLVAAAGRAA